MVSPNVFVRVAITDTVMASYKGYSSIFYKSNYTCLKSSSPSSCAEVLQDIIKAQEEGQKRSSALGKGLSAQLCNLGRGSIVRV